MIVLQKVAQLIGSRFQIRIEVRVTKFLGILIARNREGNKIKIHCALMIDHMLSNFNMSSSKTACTPLPPRIRLISTDGDT